MAMSARRLRELWLDQAALLLLDHFGWERDHGSSSDNRFYVLDTNVVVFFFEPSKNTGLIGAFKDTENLETFSKAVALELFSGQSGKRTNYVLPPHDLEVEGVLNRIRSQRTRSLNPSASPRAEQIIEQLRDARAKMTNDEFTELVGKNLDRYSRHLFGSNRVLDYLHIEHYLESGALQVAETDVNPDVDRVTFWRDLLLEEKQDTDLHLVLSDASVLAKIEKLNAAAPPKSGLTFLTADTALINAVQRAAVDRPEEPYPETDYFLYKDVRHLRGYYVNPEFIERPAVEKIVGALRVLLAPYLDNANATEESLLQLRMNGWDSPNTSPAMLDSSVEELSNSIRKIREASQLTVSMRILEKSKSELVTSAVLKLVDGFAPLTDALPDLVSQSATRFEKAADTFSMGIQSDRPERRPYPMLCFESFSASSGLAKQLVLKGLPEMLSYAGLVRDVEAEDSTGYCYQLCQALAHIVRGHWPIARNKALEALRIANTNRQSPIDGREALFLLSITYRRQATTAQEVSKSEEFLDVAIKISPTDIRFRAEKLACRLTKLLFRKFDAFGDEGWEEDAASLEEQIVLLLMQEFSTLEKTGAVEKSVRLNLITNLFVLYLQFGVASTWKQGYDQLLDEFSGLLTWYSGHFRGRRTSLCTVLLVAGKIHLSSSEVSEKELELAHEAVASLDDFGTYEYPYEPIRIFQLRELLKP